jgi:hypothetical protein
LAARAEWAREHVTVEERGGLVAQAASLEQRGAAVEQRAVGVVHPGEGDVAGGLVGAGGLGAGTDPGDGRAERRGSRGQVRDHRDEVDRERAVGGGPGLRVIEELAGDLVHVGEEQGLGVWRRPREDGGHRVAPVAALEDAVVVADELAEPGEGRLALRGGRRVARVVTRERHVRGDGAIGAELRHRDEQVEHSPDIRRLLDAQGQGPLGDGRDDVIPLRLDLGDERADLRGFVGDLLRCHRFPPTGEG